MAARHLDVAAVLDLSPRRPRRTTRPLTLKLASEHVTLREVIARAVQVEMGRADSRVEAALAELLAVLGAGSAPIRLSQRRDITAEIGRALAAFQDGRYRVLLDGRPVRALDERLSLGLRSSVTFLRVVPLVSG